jgi:hypothetical protein
VVCSESARRFRAAILLSVCAAVLCALQRPFRTYISMEPYGVVELPPNHTEKTEWVFGRLMYPPHPHARFGRY